MTYRIDYTPETQTVHVTFNTKSVANCYREKDGKFLWIINVGTNKAEGLKITPFRHIDYVKLYELLFSKTSITDSDIKSIIADLKKLLVKESA